MTWGIMQIVIAICFMLMLSALMWAYITWMAHELLKDPVDRNPVAHAIIATWQTIRRTVDWAISKIGTHPR